MKGGERVDRGEKLVFEVKKGRCVAEDYRRRNAEANTVKFQKKNKGSVGGHAPSAVGLEVREQGSTSVTGTAQRWSCKYKPFGNIFQLNFHRPTSFLPAAGDRLYALSNGGSPGNGF